MPIELDHYILAVSDRAKSLAFYTQIVGLQHDGEDGSFSRLRVTSSLVILIAPWGTSGGEHLAFSMSKPEFDAAFERVVASGMEFGDSFDSVGNMRGPGNESGSQGMGKAVYFFDPDEHLIEIRHYEDER